MPPVPPEPSCKRRRTCYACGPTESSLCRFPKEKEQLAKWSAFCNVLPIELKNSSRLCIKHFKETDLVTSRGQNWRTIKPTASPVIYTREQLEILKLSSPHVYDCIISSPKICDLTLKTSIRDNFQSILLKHSSSKNSCHTENSPRIIEETPRDISNEELCTDARSISGFEPEVCLSTTHSITNDSICTTPEGVSQFNITDAEKHSVVNESSAEALVTPVKQNNVLNQPRRNVSRSLRYIADIRSPDLDSPRRREECLKIIRYESKTMKSKLRVLQRQNQRLTAKVKTLKELIKELKNKKS